jgi:hypothetical protein
VRLSGRHTGYNPRFPPQQRGPTGSIDRLDVAYVDQHVRRSRRATQGRRPLQNVGRVILSGALFKLAADQTVTALGVALAIDANGDRAACWYERFGALRLHDDPLKLVLPLDTIRSVLEHSD